MEVEQGRWKAILPEWIGAIEAGSFGQLEPSQRYFVKARRSRKHCASLRRNNRRG
ncbi:MAG TPA: hypothetical protein VFM04_09355 [Candidatus Methylomirabilis sp.]|nr:hypothetical protein [Candidatus Methylomirabilis sp.]